MRLILLDSDKQNDNFALALSIFVHFFAVTAWQRRETSWIHVSCTGHKNGFTSTANFEQIICKCHRTKNWHLSGFCPNGQKRSKMNFWTLLLSIANSVKVVICHIFAQCSKSDQNSFFNSFAQDSKSEQKFTLFVYRPV